jgi:hypothetical protein
MPPSTLDAERIPRWFSVTIAVGCCLSVALFAAITHGSALAREIVAVVSALVAAGMFWICRFNFRKLLAKQLPRRGPAHWLTTQPIPMMVLAYLAYVLAVVAIGAAAWSIAHLPVAGFLVGASPVFALVATTQIAAWLELRRRQDSHSY